MFDLSALFLLLQPLFNLIGAFLKAIFGTGLVLGLAVTACLASGCSITMKAVPTDKKFAQVNYPDGNELASMQAYDLSFNGKLDWPFGEDAGVE